MRSGSMVPVVLAMLVLAGTAGCVPWKTGRIRQAEYQALTNPESADAWVALGDANRSAHHKKAANSAYQQALSLDPSNEPARAGASALVKVRAFKKLQKQALKEPRNDEVWGDMGDHMFASGQVDQALRYFEHALDLDPSDEEWKRRVLEIGGEETLLTFYQNRMQDESTNDEMVGDYADILYSLGRRDEACVAFQRAHDLDAADNEWITALERCGVTMTGGTPSQVTATAVAPTGSIDELKAQLVSDPKNAALLGALAGRYLASGDKVKALENYRLALQEECGRDEWLSSVVLLSGESKLAILDRLSLLRPNDDEVWGQLGYCYLELGRSADALKAFRKASELDPSDTEWRAKLDLLSGGR